MRRGLSVTRHAAVAREAAPHWGAALPGGGAHPGQEARAAVATSNSTVTLQSHTGRIAALINRLFFSQDLSPRRSGVLN